MAHDSTFSGVAGDALIIGPGCRSHKLNIRGKSIQVSQNCLRLAVSFGCVAYFRKSRTSRPAQEPRQQSIQDDQ